MAFCYDNLKLDKGMYQEAGSTFTQVLERQDPSDQYKGTSLEGLDAFQRQLKRFDIRVKGAGSDVVEKFFRTADSAVLFPEYIARTCSRSLCVRWGPTSPGHCWPTAWKCLSMGTATTMGPRRTRLSQPAL